jgi:hypothetical protein
MAYGIIRVRNITASGIAATEIHNEREYQDKNIKCPGNIHLDKSDLNISHIRGQKTPKKGIKGENTISYKEAIENRLKMAGIKPKSNSVHAIEFMVSASSDFFNDWIDPKTGKKYPGYSPMKYFKDSIEWLQDRYGSENNICFAIHMDKSTPHMHMLITPIQEKEVKWKNRRGEGTKIENRLCARDITGGPELLRKLQDDFYQHVSNKYADHAIWYRGTLVEHQLKKYTKQTNHEIGELRKKLEGVSQDAAEEIQKLIKEKQEEMERTTADLQKKVEIRHDRNKGDGWKKGQIFEHGQEPTKPRGPKL